MYDMDTELTIASEQLVPIDFGHAFGSASGLLPVPDLLLFRMTNQLLGVVETLDVDSTLLVTVANILRGKEPSNDLYCMVTK